MRKLIGTIVILFVAAYLAIQVFGASMVSSAISGATGAKTSVNRVHLKLFPFELGIYGTRIHNLEGFQEPELMSIPEIFVRVNLADLLKGVAHVEKISLNLDHVTFERTQGGKINLKELLDHSKQKQKEAEAKEAPKPSETKPQEPAPAKPGMKTQIDEVVLSLGSLTYADYGSGQRVEKKINIKVENEVLHHVTDTFSLVQQVIVIIIKRIGLSTLGIQMDIFKGSVGESAGEIINQAKDKLSQLFA